MAQQFNEPEERTNVVEASFNPLDEAVNEKSYSRPNINTNSAEFTRPIEEPSFAPPPMERRTIQQEDPKKREPFNPELKELPKKDKEMAASQMAKMIIQAYEWGHDLANKGLMISERKLNKLQSEGEINLNAMIDYEYGKKIRAGEFFQEWNGQIQKDGGVLKVSDEFKEETTPVLERVLAKRGIGLTDEQMLIYLFGKDIAAKGLIFFQMKGQVNFMIQSIKEATSGQFNQQAPPPQPTPSQPTHPPQEAEFVQEAEPVSKYYEEKVEAIKPDVIVLPKRRGRPSSKD